MRYKTDLDAVKHVAISLLHTHINETKFSPMVVQHPFTNSAFVGISNNGEMELLNILESSESKVKWQEFMEKQINNADSVYRIFMMVNKPYALTFLKLASKHLSFDDFSRILGDAWIMSENPNCDANVTQAELVDFFVAADPEVIMTPEERKELAELDDVSKTRKRMSQIDRAAQFSPFAALTGYDSAILETARLTDKRIELDEGTKAILNEKLTVIADFIKEQPEVTITYFEPDKKKDGGAYVDYTGTVRRIDEYERAVIMTDKTAIPIEQIYDIQCELFGNYEIE